MGTLKRPQKIYFVRFSDDTDEPMCFTHFSDLKTFMEEAAFEGDTIDYWKIYSCNKEAL